MDRNSEQTLTLTWQFADFLLTTSINLSSNIEEEYSTGFRRFILKRRFSDEDFQVMVTEFCIALLHFVDRRVFEIWGNQKRIAFMDSLVLTLSGFGSNSPMNRAHPVPAFVWKREGGIGIRGLDPTLYEERGSEYSRCKVISAEGEPRLRGTVSWEAGKYVSRICAKYGMSNSKMQFSGSSPPKHGLDPNDSAYR